MGIGPWALGDAMRDVEAAERARFRRLLKREQNRLLEGRAPSRSDLVAAFDRIRAGLAPKLQKETPKVVNSRVERYCDHPGRGY